MPEPIPDIHHEVYPTISQNPEPSKRLMYLTEKINVTVTLLVKGVFLCLTNSYCIISALATSAKANATT